jgi:hypothetical protein
MINSTNFQEIIYIISKANEFLIDHDCPHFSIMSVNWDEDELMWLVSYQSDYSQHEFINVWVREIHNGNFGSEYALAGHTFEKIEVKIRG